MILRRWFAERRPEPVATPEGLRAYLHAEAALVAQKCLVGYCHVKTRLPLTELMRDADFRTAYETSRWEGFAAVLEDLVAIVEAHLRTAVGDRGVALADSLADLYRDMLAEQPRPGAPEAGWQEVADEGRKRLHRLLLTPPKTVADIAWTSATRLYEALPIHQDLRRPDKDAVVASVRFMLVSRCGRLERRLDRGALVRALLDGA